MAPSPMTAAAAMFTVADYLVLLVILAILSAIGLYYRYTGGRQRSTEEYLLGDRSQGVLPVALSLVSSHMSGISLLGSPAEVYYRGAIYCLTNISLAFVIPVTVHFFLPVFFKVGSSSAYEYLELRFGRKLRSMAALTYPLQSVLFMAVVLYAPSLALQTLSGLPPLWSILVVGSVCTFYSVVGGIKAVIMTDVFQFLLSVLAVAAIIWTAYLDKGSFSAIWNIAAEGGRLNFWNPSVNPTERHTWWSLVVGATFTYLGSYAVHQAQVQRYLTLQDRRTAARTLYISWPITTAFSLSLSFAGLCIYSRYHNCDPLKAGVITSEDRLVPLYVADSLSRYPGLAGLAVAGVFSASLSTVSAGLNSLATITVQDYIQPVYQICTKASLPQGSFLFLSKLVGCGYGMLLMAMAYLAHHVTGILQTGLSLTGLVGGPLVAVYSLGVAVPAANEPGAIAALVSGLGLSFWLSFGGPKPPVVNLPSLTASCPTNLTLEPLQSLPQLPQLRDEDATFLYVHRLSYWWTVVLSYLLAFLTGLVVSLYSRKVHDCRPVSDPDFFAPPIAAYLMRKHLHSSKDRCDVVRCDIKNKDYVN